MGWIEIVHCTCRLPNAEDSCSEETIILRSFTHIHTQGVGVMHILARQPQIPISSHNATLPKFKLFIIFFSKLTYLFYIRQLIEISPVASHLDPSSILNVANICIWKSLDTEWDTHARFHWHLARGMRESAATPPKLTFRFFIPHITSKYLTNKT